MRKKLLFIIFCLSALTGFAQTANTHSQTDDLKGKRIGVSKAIDYAKAAKINFLKQKAVLNEKQKQKIEIK